MTKFVIVDIDGTIADNSHRRVHLKTTPKNWKAYKQNMELDTPIQPMIRLLQELMDTGVVPIFLTGREEEYRHVTLKWLDKHVHYMGKYHLFMREDCDYRDDTKIKVELLDKAQEEVGFSFVDLLGVFEDRKKVKRTWVDLGLFVFDVNQTDEEF